MKILLTTLIATFLMISCSNPESTRAVEVTNKNNGAEEKVELPIPKDLEKEFIAIQDEYEYRLKNSFWGTFTPRTRRGREGATSTVFDMTALEKFLLKKKFHKTEGGSSGDFDGEKDGIKIFLDNHGSVASNSGWIQLWEIRCTKEIGGQVYSSSREIRL
ncbi:MAG: hypothetical protein ACO1O1_13200 [Adhaeribacter sp.]